MNLWWLTSQYKLLRQTCRWGSETASSPRTSPSRPGVCPGVRPARISLRASWSLMVSVILLLPVFGQAASQHLKYRIMMVFNTCPVWARHYLFSAQISKSGCNWSRNFSASLQPDECGVACKAALPSPKQLWTNKKKKNQHFLIANYGIKQWLDFKIQ